SKSVDVPWFAITSGTSGTGNGTVNYSVAANNGPTRSGIITIADQTFTINQDSAATHFSVSAPASATAGTAFNFTVTALDGSNSTVTSYSGTVHFTSSDPQAVLPANTTLTNGTGSLSATLKTAGTQTISGTDTVNGSITGTSNNIAVSAAAATHFS